MRTLSLLLLGLTACATEDHSDAPPEFRCPELNLQGQGSLKAFIDAFGEKAPRRLIISQIDGNWGEFSELKRLKSLEILELSGWWNVQPFEERNGTFYFKVALSDDAVREIVEIEKLSELTIWYGSLSEAQRRRILQRHPACKLYDNANKL